MSNDKQRSPLFEQAHTPAWEIEKKTGAPGSVTASPAGVDLDWVKKRVEEEDVMSLIDVCEPDEIPGNPSLDNLQCSEENKKRIVRRIIDPFLYPELRAGGIQPASVLIFGPPGTGKTLMAQIIAREAKAILVVVTAMSIRGRYFGQSEARLNKIMDYVDKLSRTRAVVLLFDECDTWLGRTSSAVGCNAISAFLTCMNRIHIHTVKRTLSVIYTTNKPYVFHEMTIRHCFPTMLYMGPPNAEQRYKYLENQIGRLPAISPDLDLAQLARETRGYSCVDLERLLEEANMERVDRSARPLRLLPVTNEYLETARRKISPSLSDDVVAPYEKFAAQRDMLIPQYD